MPARQSIIAPIGIGSSCRYDFQRSNKNRSSPPFGLWENKSLNNFETIRGRKPALSSISTTENFFISMVIVPTSSLRRYFHESSELNPFCIAHAAIVCAVMTCPIEEIKAPTRVFKSLRYLVNSLDESRRSSTKLIGPQIVRALLQVGLTSLSWLVILPRLWLTPSRQYHRTDQRIISHRKCRHLKSLFKNLAKNYQPSSSVSEIFAIKAILAAFHSDEGKASAIVTMS